VREGLSDLKCDALALSETLKKMLADTQEALAKSDEKRRREKEASNALVSFIDLAKLAT
jgi:hypothetical protein